MTAPGPYRPATPYRSQAGPGRDWFARLLHAEWTKFRTVRGWGAGLLIAAGLAMAISLSSHKPTCALTSSSSSQSSTTACAEVPIGPGGEPVTDHFYFVHQPLAGDGSVTVQVTSLTGRYSTHGPQAGPSGISLGRYQPGVQPWTKAGVMIKASTTPGSAYAAMMVTGAHGVRMQDNYTGDIAGLPGAVTASSPRWLRLVRSGSTVTGYESRDGGHWTRVGAVTLSGLPPTAQVGLFAASPDYGGMPISTPAGPGGPSVATATFDHVALSGAKGTWTGTSVGNGGPVPVAAIANLPRGASDPFIGSYRVSGGTYTVTGSGDIAPAVPGAVLASGGGNLSTALRSSAFLELIAMVIVGALFVTAEYRRGLISTTFTASPRRGRVLAAKAVVLGGVTFLVGLAGMAVALPVVETSTWRGVRLFAPVPALTTARMVVGLAALLAVSSVLALAVGVITRRGVAAVTAVIVTTVLPFLLSVVPGVLPASAQDWLLRVSPAAGFAVEQTIRPYHQVVAHYTPLIGYYPLPWWGGLLVLASWTALALAAAAYLLRRRDV